MEGEALKRVKNDKISTNKMFIDSEAVVITVIPFLTPYETMQYFATNKQIREQYDNRTIWNRLMPKWTRIPIGNIKKCLHFEQLTKKYTLPNLVDEATSVYQLGLIRLYCNMLLPVSVKNTFKSLIYLVTPHWLKRQSQWNNTVRFETFPRFLNPVKSILNTYTMDQLIVTVKAL